MDDFYTFDPRVSGVKGIMYIGNKILVYRRDDKTDHKPLQLDFPGGGADKNESPFEAFRREVKEEFGLDLSPKEIIYWRQYPSAIYPGQVTYFPVAKLPEGAKSKIKFGDEGLEWFLMDAKEYIKSPDAVDYLLTRTKDYLEHVSKKAN